MLRDFGSSRYFTVYEIDLHICKKYATKYSTKFSLMNVLRAMFAFFSVPAVFGTRKPEIRSSTEAESLVPSKSGLHPLFGSSVNSNEPSSKSVKTALVSFLFTCLIMGLKKRFSSTFYLTTFFIASEFSILVNTIWCGESRFAPFQAVCLMDLRKQRKKNTYIVFYICLGFNGSYD